ncbi:sulfurtransferase TusA family protein [Haladaptatus sp. DFWS20]|jgi:tRNA 2-thiouridine synthesizing protein A|uniref:sulfurtransferase TusA family protein n=1 Tax=Haladaptatus sp. DFWS20 TaxID=3403467 RepID=UPI003EBEB6D2
MPKEYEITETLDVTGLNCPIPVIKTKQAIDALDIGAVLEVQATDPGSVPDINGWANATEGVDLVDQFEEEESGEIVYKHHVRKVS